MDAALLIADARRTAGLSLRALAARAGTSHATISAYEAGRVTPNVETLDRILRAAGFAACVELTPQPDAAPDERVRKGDELVEALELAALFPARHAPTLQAPAFPPESRSRRQAVVQP